MAYISRLEEKPGVFHVGRTHVKTVTETENVVHTESGQCRQKQSEMMRES